MPKMITCIDCPQGCRLEVETDGSRVISVTGNKCEKGAAYAGEEIANPRRVVTSTVLARGLELKLVPVRTSGPIPKDKIGEAMREIRELSLERPVTVGEAIERNFLGLGVDLVATRSARPV